MADTERRVVLITGCTPGGIGHALALDFFSRGLHVIATARSSIALQTLTDDPAFNSQKGKLTTLTLDVTSQESIAEAFSTVSSLTNSRLDILVNNAGRAYPIPALDASLSQTKSVFDTNVFGVMSMVQAFTPLLLSTATTLLLPHPPSHTLPPSLTPQIVMIGSISAVNPYTFGSIYNASKAALHAYTNTLRLELAPFSINVSLIITGGIRSNIAILRTSPTSSTLQPATELLPLPPSSLYLPITPEYNRRQTHSQEGATPTELYASQVVDAVLAGKKEVWLGNKSHVIYWVLAIFGRWVLDRMMVRMFGLDRLRVIWRAGLALKKKVV